MRRVVGGIAMALALVIVAGAGAAPETADVAFGVSQSPQLCARTSYFDQRSVMRKRPEAPTAS